MVWLNKGLHACEASLWVPADVVFVARCFIATLYLPWVPEVFSRVHREASFRRSQANTCSAEGRKHERRS